MAGALLIPLAISAATTAASYGLEYLQAKKAKVAPVDRGKQDDIRTSLPGYGELIPKIWGTARVAPIWIWETPAVDHPITTAGKSGGKSPKPPTPTTTDHVYVKSIAGVFHDGEIYGGVRRMWFDTDLVFNGLTSAAAGGGGGGEISSHKYEAEYGLLAGGASITTQAECSGGKKVTGLGSGGKVTITASVATDDYELAVHYTSTVDRTFKVYLDGSLLGDIFCSASGGAGIVAIETWPSTISLSIGAHLFRFENSGAACPDLDYIDLVRARNTDEIDTRSFSSVIDPSKIPASDQNHAWSYNNFQPDVGDGSGAGGVAGTPFQTFTLSGYGQPTIRVYRGTTTQNADSAIIAQEGAANTSAYRGWAYIVIEGLQLQNGRVPNVTLEADQGVHSVPAIAKDIYSLVGESQVNVDALNGLSLGDSDIDPGTYSAVTYANTANVTTGSGGVIHKTSGADHAWNAYAAGNTSITSGINGAVRFTADSGPILVGLGADASPTVTSDMQGGILLNITSNPSLETKNAIQFWNGVTQSPDIGIWHAGDQFQVEERDGKIRVYQNGIEIQSFTPPVLSYPLYPQIFMYNTGAGVSALTVSTSGAIGEEPSSDAGGLLLSSRRSAGELLADLQTRFQFDLVEIDGVVKAILRNGSTADITIPYTDMRAVIAPQGQLPELPEWDCEIHDIDQTLLPQRVDVNYLDPGLDYHNNVQSEMVLSGVPRQDNQSVSLAIIDQADNIKKLAITLMHKAEMEGRSFSWQTSYKYLHAHPGSIASLTLPSATHTVRITQAKYQLPCGVIEWQGVRQAPSVYSPTAIGSGSSGFEPPIAPHPANTKGVIIDGPLLRSEDAGDGTQPVVYVAMCGRGSGAWNGAFFYKEFPVGSGNYQLETQANQQSQIGVTSGTLATASDPSVWDRNPAHALTLNFLTNTTLASETAEDLQLNPQLNLLAIINPATNEVEYIQFSTAVAGTPTAPYLSQFTVSNFLRGRFGTDGNVSTHTAADDVVFIDSTIKPRRMQVADIGRSLNFKFVTSGQVVDDAALVTQTFHGTSLRPLAPSNIRGTRDTEGNLLIEWTRRSRAGFGMMPGSDVPLSEEIEHYEVDILDGSNNVLRTLKVDLSEGVPAVLIATEGAEGVVGNSVDSDLVLTTSHSINAYTSQTLDRPGSFIEARLTVPSSLTDPGFANLGLIEPQYSPQLGTIGLADLPIYRANLGFAVYGTPGIRITENASGDPAPSSTVYTSGALGVTAVRVRIEISDSGTKYYWDYTGDGSVPFYTSDLHAPLPAFGVISVVGPDTAVQNVIIGQRTTPSTHYDIDKQTLDFGSPQTTVGSIRVRVYQVSAIIGRGAYAQANL